MPLDNYILAHIDPEGDLLSALNRDAHVNLLRPRMQSGHLQGRILKMFCRMIQPQKILEIGAYTAYATLCMAEALDGDATIDTIEINDEMEPFIRKYLDRSPHNRHIRLHIGDARTVVPSLNGTFDLVFIDADKRQYTQYYDLVFDRVRPNGFIIVDNTLWNGKAYTVAPHDDPQTAAIKTFNDRIARDRRIEKVILPLRDGLTIICKKQLINNN
jgi:predicted O-methyltransferase YrrM